MARYRCGSAVVAAVNGQQRGFALLIVLWTVGFLALLGTQIVAAGRSDTQLADNLKQEAILEAAADGAVANITFRMLGARDPVFQADGIVREVRIEQTLTLVQVEDESDRINLNTASGALLKALITELGGAPAQAEQIAGAILDWRTSGTNPRQAGAKAPEYLAAGRAYGPPGTPFQSVDELADVLGMTPDLLARMTPHLTVLTDGDPDISTRDLEVARALSDAAGVADDSAVAQPTSDRILRINVTAVGKGPARYSMVVVVSAEFQNATPRLNILLRRRGVPLTNSRIADASMR